MLALGIVAYNNLFNLVVVDHQVFEHFKLYIAEQVFGGTFPKVGSPLKTARYRLAIYYYSDFVFDNSAFHGISYNDIYVPARRTYEIRPRNTLGAFGYGGYTRSDPATIVYKTGRNDSLPEGCSAALYIPLLYNSEFEHREPQRRERESVIDSIYRYGEYSPTEADFKAIFVDNQGMLKSDIRRALLLLALGVQGEGMDYVDPNKYDILIEFYRYDANQKFDFTLYDEADIFESLPEISVIEYSN